MSFYGSVFLYGLSTQTHTKMTFKTTLCVIIQGSRDYSTGRQSLVTSLQSPVTRHQSPVTSQHSPLISHQSPVTASHEAPVTGLQSPVTSHRSLQSPVTSHWSLVTSNAIDRDNLFALFARRITYIGFHMGEHAYSYLLIS